MATMLQKKGTCPACMGTFHVYDEDGKVVVGKHGWQEVGGRRVGEYGLASHMGSCFGVGWAPFEISPEGTFAFLCEVRYPTCLGHISALANYETRPAISRLTYKGNEQVMVTLTPENEEGSKRVWTRDGYRPRYDIELDSAMSRERTVQAHNVEMSVLLLQKAESWTTGVLLDALPEGPTVHFKKEGARGVFCGSRSHALTSTQVEADVNCTRCLKALATAKREREAREAIAADADTLVALLEKSGPQTIAQIKKALGWDTKRANRAIERARSGSGLIGAPREYRVTCDYSDKGPDKYRVTTEEERARWAR